MQSAPTKVSHTPVLLEESINGLEIKSGDVVVDGTFGGGGHSLAIYKRYSDIKHLICVDLDEEAEMRYDKIFDGLLHVNFVHSNFKDVNKILSASGFQTVDKVLLDLGTSTFQLLADTRGFSFQTEAPLHMAFSKEGSHTEFTAWDIVNVWEESSIADILFYYGEEKKARHIAKAIIEVRKSGPIKTAKALADIIESVIKRKGHIHPATKSFQALRIAVNDELQVITEALDVWWSRLNTEGRIAVITFHSLEDRIVKQWMKKKTNERVITKKPIAPSLHELQANRASRSAKLRIIEKIS